MFGGLEALGLEIGRLEEVSWAVFSLSRLALLSTIGGFGSFCCRNGGPSVILFISMWSFWFVL